MRDSCTRRAPAWWPVGEPWPPRHRQFGTDSRIRARFFRRVVAAAIALLLLAASGAFALAWIVISRFGLAGWAASVAVLGVVVAGGIVVAIVVRTMRRFTLQLRAVMDAADRVAGGDYAVRLEERVPPPVRALAHSFNTMIQRLRDADRQRRDMMADVAHELRTPLSVLQARLEGLMDGVYPRDDAQLAQLLESTRVLSRLIDDLRTLALSDAGVLDLQRESTDLVGLVRDAVRGFETEASSRAVSLTVRQTVDAAVLEIDPLRIRQVFVNILSNSLRYTPAGGSVDVSITAADERVTVSVRDTGEGVPSEDVKRIFERFYKGATSRGSGLGLTIAKSLVIAHGGEITASSEVGKGMTVNVALPVHWQD